MTKTSRGMIRWITDRFFYIEQWFALFLGLILLGVSIWSTFHLPESTPSTSRPWMVNAIIAAHLNWLLLLAADVIAVTLFRFALHVPAEKPNGEKISSRRADQLKNADGESSTRLEKLEGRS